MYGQVAGAGMAAGVPAALAFTGATGGDFAIMLGIAFGFIGAGIALLRWSHSSR